MGGHADGQSGEQGHPQQVRKEPACLLAAENFVDEEAQQHENAGEKADVIVGENGEEQGQGVQGEAVLLQQLHHAQHHQRQQGKGVQPHDVPLIPQRPGAKAVEAAEKNERSVIFPKNGFQENGEEAAGQPQLDGHQQGEIPQQPPLRQQHADEIQRRGQIVGDKAQIVHAQTHAPGVEQSAAGADGLPEGHEEGIILVVHIRVEHGILPEGRIPTDDHDRQQPYKGQGKGKGRVIPLSILSVQTHGAFPPTLNDSCR